MYSCICILIFTYSHFDIHIFTCIFTFTFKFLHIQILNIHINDPPPKPTSYTNLLTLNHLGILWAIDCRAFRKIMMRPPSSVLMKKLQQIDLLEPLRFSQLTVISDVVNEAIFEQDQVIVSEEENGSDSLYLILQGTVALTWKDAPQSKTLKAPQVFSDTFMSIHVYSHPIHLGLWSTRPPVQRQSPGRR